ncbi:zonular occludens toxin domain-containing protein [Acinetobacter colistiniresistens]|uniref:zonular occludens toxin domain-containing protein n=1 Tax=Acinetobacter colistiniresistens TaxID=280145 RepID=UPI000E5ACCE9|nr:zonular occludens toxin domain-containing protein [Acinetobacter colistiniresistens]
MAILISAPIRTGKTLYTIKLIFEYLNKGRQVYTNIVGINIDGVISVSSSINDPFDWRDLPNGSVLVWDEAHEHPAFSEQDLLKTYKIDESPFDERLALLNSDPNITLTKIKENTAKIEKAKKEALEKRKEEIRDIGRSLLLHGHFGIEIILITQRVTKLNLDVFGSVTTHFVMRRKFGMDAAVIWEFGEAMTTWSRSTAATALNRTLWRYPKYLYKFYVSSENHQVRKSFPAKYIAFGCIPLLMMGYGFMKAKETGFMGLFPKEEKQVVQAAPVAHPADSVSVQNNAAQHEVVCSYQTINQPECAEYARLKNEKLQQEVRQIVSYNPNDPYMSEVPDRIEFAADDFPRLTGCIKYGGKYFGIDQQGNRMPKVPQEACRRWIEDSQRPFDYFANNHRSNYKDNKKKEDKPASPVETATQNADLTKYAEKVVSPTPTT